MRNCFYFQGQLRATGGSVTQKCPLRRARLQAPITAEEFQIPRIRHSLAQHNEVFSAPTRLQRSPFSPRLQQQLSFKAQTPALRPDPLQPSEATQTRSDALAPRRQARQGGILPATRSSPESCLFHGPQGQHVDVGIPEAPAHTWASPPGRSSCSWSHVLPQIPQASPCS